MHDEPAKNLIFYNPDGFFEVIISGRQTEDSFKELFEQAKPLMEKVTAEGKALRGLMDMTNQTGYSLSSDKAALELLESINYDKLAMYNPPHSAVAEGIIMAMGRGERTKVFGSREEAINWLKS